MRKARDSSKAGPQEGQSERNPYLVPIPKGKCTKRSGMLCYNKIQPTKPFHQFPLLITHKTMKTHFNYLVNHYPVPVWLRMIDGWEKLLCAIKPNNSLQNLLMNTTSWSLVIDSGMPCNQTTWLKTTSDTHCYIRVSNMNEVDEFDSDPPKKTKLTSLALMVIP